jgi:hypothetical protein
VPLPHAHAARSAPSELPAAVAELPPARRAPQARAGHLLASGPSASKISRPDSSLDLELSLKQRRYALPWSSSKVERWAHEFLKRAMDEGSMILITVLLDWTWGFLVVRPADFEVCSAFGFSGGFVVVSAKARRSIPSSRRGPGVPHFFGGASGCLVDAALLVLGRSSQLLEPARGSLLDLF